MLDTLSGGMLMSRFVNGLSSTNDAAFVSTNEMSCLKMSPISSAAASDASTRPPVGSLIGKPPPLPFHPPPFTKPPPPGTLCALRPPPKITPSAPPNPSPPRIAAVSSMDLKSLLSYASQAPW